MRKYIIIALAAVCLFGLWPGEVHAQRGLPKQKGIQITAGWVDGFSFVKAGRRLCAANTGISSAARTEGAPRS